VFVRYGDESDATWSAEDPTFSRIGSGVIVVTGLVNTIPKDFTAYVKTPAKITSDWTNPQSATPTDGSVTLPAGIVGKVLVDDAIYWAPDSVNQFGEKTFSAPIGLKVRWEDSATQIVTPEGEEIVSRSLIMIDRDIEYGGYLKHGIITGGVNANPMQENDAYPVLLKKDTPNIKNTVTLREVYL